MKINVMDRLMLLTVLPKEGSFASLKLLRVAREALSFSDDELKILNLREEVDTGGVKRLIWNEGVEDKEINLGKTVTDMVVEQLKTLDKQNRLTESHIPIYEKFIERKDQ